LSDGSDHVLAVTARTLRVFVKHPVDVRSAASVAVDSAASDVVSVSVCATLSAADLRSVLSALLPPALHALPVALIALPPDAPSPTVHPLACVGLMPDAFGERLFGVLCALDDSVERRWSALDDLVSSSSLSLSSTRRRRRARADSAYANDDDDDDNDDAHSNKGEDDSSALHGLAVSTGSVGGAPTATSATSTAAAASSSLIHVIELSAVRIGTWEVVGKMKGELTLVIDEGRSVIQYRWRKPNTKKQTFVTYVIQFAFDLLVSAHVNETGSVAAAEESAAQAESSGSKRKQVSDSEPLFKLDWMLELRGPPVFYKSDDKPLKKTTESAKSMSAVADVKTRRVDGTLLEWNETTDFTQNEQATTYRRHVVVAVEKPGARLSRLLADKPYLSNLNQLQLFPMPGLAGVNSLTFGSKKK
jgi:hypothetical protein